MEVSSTLRHVEIMKYEMQIADSIKYLSQKKQFDFETERYKADFKTRLDSVCKAEGIKIENYPNIYGSSDSMLSGIGMMRFFRTKLESGFDYAVLLLFYVWVLFQLAVYLEKEVPFLDWSLCRIYSRSGAYVCHGSHFSLRTFDLHFAYSFNYSRGSDD